MRTLSALSLALALLALPANANAYGQLLSEQGCVDVSNHAARIRVEGGQVTTEVDLQIGNVWNGAEAADPKEITWYMPALGDLPTVTGDGTPLQVDLLDAEAAIEEGLNRAEDLGDSSLLEFAGHPVWRVRLGAAQLIQIVELRPLVVERGVAQIVHSVRTCGANSSFNLEATFVDGPATVLSPYHTLALEQLEDGSVVARHQSSGARHFDVHLYTTQADEDASVGSGLVSFRDATCDPDAPGFFALTAGPRPGAAAEKPTRAKDIVLVLDSSGSMGGEKLRQAQAALDHVLTGLGAQDRFEVVDFDSQVRSLHGGLREATPAAIEDARAFVRRLDAGGGTFIEGGLSEGMGALRGRENASGRPAFVVFATDGQATDGVTDRQALIDLATDANLAEARLFPFGIGYDVNAFLLDGLAAANHGLSSFIRPGQDIEVAIASFYEQIRTPVMTNVELGSIGAKPEALVPDEMPDLFDGSQVLLVGKYSAGDPASLALVGDTDGDGRLTAITPDGGLLTAGTAHGFVPRLWATRRVAQLIDWDRKEAGDTERVAEIERLANRFGLVTPWTQFVKDERGNVSNSYSRPDGGESGERAVGHSSDNNDMRGTDNASDYAGGAEVENLVRHRAERTFVIRDGRWWDTSLADDAVIHDVTCGSEAYGDLVRQAPALGRWMAVGHEVVFRVGCEGVRVSAGDREELPEETLQGADALPSIDPEETWAAPADFDTPEELELVPAAEEELEDDEALKGVGCGCEIATTQAPPWSWALLGLAIVLRRRATVRRTWTRNGSPTCTRNTAPSSSDVPGRS
jgi:Ca-activated chloride channel family protein